jgi:hypothetical protein
MKNNIANYYVLPMLKLNKASFGGEGNFVNSYITQDDEIVVEVKDKMLVPEENFMDNPEYLGDFDSEDTTKIVFSQPKETQNDILLFAQGKYSEMSLKAKELIVMYSGLPYNKVRKDLPKKVNGQYQTETSKYLLALSRAESLRKKMENDLGTQISKDAELVAKPTMNNFYPLPELTN